MGHVMDLSNPNEHLLERILSRENMQAAWKRVKANKGAAGVDGMSIDAFLDFARDEWEKIRKELLAGAYQPSPVRRVEIPKATGGTRPLGIPTVLDRLIQQASPRFWFLCLIRHSRIQASGSDRDGLPMMRFTRFANTSERAIAWP
jgi:retron-type reverse transcriptase